MHSIKLNFTTHLKKTNKQTIVAQSQKQKQIIEIFLKMIQLLELEDKDFQLAITGMFKDMKEVMMNR